MSPEPVLTDEIADLARAVADRYGGTLADVLRLAIPPRHARTEAAGRAQRDEAADGPAPDDTAPAPRPPDPGPGSWARYPAGASFLAALADGRSPRAVWSALPGPDWPEEIARAAATAAAAGRGALIVVPDGRDLDNVDAALAALLGSGSHVCLSAGLGPAERYRRWLTVLRGRTLMVAGTRSAMFAPVTDLGLVVLWDDGDDLHAEPRAPYPHAREVLALRAHRRARGRADRRVRPDRGGDPAGRRRLGARARRRPGRGAPPRAADHRGRGRHGAGPGSGRPLGPAARPRAAHRPGCAGARAGAVPGAAARLRGRGRLRTVPRARPSAPCCGGPLALAGPRSAASAAGAPRPPRPGVPPVRARRAARAGHRGRPHRRGTRPGLPVRAGADLRPGRGDHRGAVRRRPSSSPRRAPSRAPRAVTRPPSCSTAGCCSAGPACALPRRRCAAG